jgi:hypothetical protein
MPTVLRVDGFSFYFYSKDHEPAHVHCTYGDGTAIISIATAEVRHKDGMREKDARRAEAIVVANREFLQAAWDAFAKKRGRQWP